MRSFSRILQPALFATGLIITFSGCTKSVIYFPDQESSSTSASPSRKKLFQAVMTGSSTEVLNLLKSGNDINGEPIVQGKDQVTPLMAAIILGKKETASLLILQGASLAPSFHGYTARDFAFLLNQTDLIVLMEKGKGK